MKNIILFMVYYVRKFYMEKIFVFESFHARKIYESAAAAKKLNEFCQRKHNGFSVLRIRHCPGRAYLSRVTRQRDCTKFKPSGSYLSASLLNDCQ